MTDWLALAVEGVSKSYGKGSAKITALKNVSVNVAHGELVALLGPSGSGKSTLLHIMGLIEKPDEGRVILNGNKVSTDEKPWLVRGRKVAIVYQAYNLVSRLTALENVALPLLVRGIAPRKANEEAVAKLGQVGLVSKVRSRPSELSGGEQQRIAIARAIASEAEYILADEPTGNLDSENGKRIVELLSELGDTNRGVLVATHDLDLAAMADRVIKIKDGKIRHGRAGCDRIDMWQIKLALRSLSSAKMRSTLTIIGVIIGVSLIVTTMVVSSSAFAWMNSTVFGRGTNIIELTIGGNNSIGGFSINPYIPVFGNDTVQALRSVAGTVAVYPSGMVDHFELVNGEAISLISIPIGFVDPAFLSTVGVRLQNGSLVSDGIILSAGTARLLNATLGENLTLSVPGILTNVTYPVVAVFTTSNSAFGDFFVSGVYLPISAWHGPYTVIFVEAAGINDITDVQSNALKVATQNATVSTVGMNINAFSLQSLFSSSVSLYTTLLNFFLIFGLFALAIGGTGVSNVMLMKLKESVERDRDSKKLGCQRPFYSCSLSCRSHVRGSARRPDWPCRRPSVFSCHPSLLPCNSHLSICPRHSDWAFGRSRHRRHVRSLPRDKSV